MEKSKGRRRRSMKNSFCMPKLRSNNNCSSRKNNRLSPMSLLDRFRDAVFRLIMLSAMSKATQQDQQRSNSSPISHKSCNYSHEHYHSEAVADCIEFIKKSSTIDEGGDSSEVIFPVPVI
ncbi:hypothetical protein P3S68_017875 [Capsicum galapagoense]